MTHRVLLLSLALAVSGCITRTHGNSIAVTGGSSDDDRTRIAQAFATQDRLEHLRAQLKLRFPTVPDEQLGRLYLGWSRRTDQSVSGGSSTTTVTVVVRIQYDADFDPKPLIAAATELIESELNARPSPPV